MTDAQRTHLRALAARVRTEEPTEALRDAVLIAMRWARNHQGRWWVIGSGWQDTPPNPLTSLDAAAAAMPEGWRVHSVGQYNEGWLAVLVRNTDYLVTSSARAFAPTEPRARTSAALEAMAAEGEA